MFVQNHHSLEELQRLTKALTKKRIWLRHQAVVLAKQGHSAPAIARALGCSRRAVQAWVDRYNQGGLAALQERPHTDVMKTWPCADFSFIRDLLRILAWHKPVFAGIEPILRASLGTSPRRP